ncbi:cation efflux system protein CusF [Enterobacteriaceae bacterium H4N4]|uniref:Cation efflux system protein CusF n=1 Tax=Silvania confinis TaxID=2926470 RepID=A0A9J6QDC6_9ENTR|nr:cation efflux system protein CusF [Silvania confinis]MCU6667374.1 cation efflux system protein CusF [Silvania confinis]
MKTLSNALIFGLFSVVMSGAQANEMPAGEMSHMHAATQQDPAVSATGEVKLIDMKENKITIAHEPVAALNWPAMTMRFTLTSDTQAQGINAGDKVDFSFIQQGNLSLLQQIHVKNN